jgi:transposase
MWWQRCADCAERLAPGDKHKRCTACRNKPTGDAAGDAPLRSPSPPRPLAPFEDRPRARSHLSQPQRLVAASLLLDHQSERDVAAKVNTTVRAVQRVKQRADMEALVSSVADAPRSGRPHKLTEDQRLDVALASRDQPFDTPRVIKRKLQLDDVSARTIARTLDDAGIPSHLARHQRHLTEDEKRQRLAFAEGYQGWTEEQWCTVLFADEKMFYGEGHPGRVYVRRPDEASSVDDTYTAHHLPHPPKVPAWACFSAHGPGYMRIRDEGAERGDQRWFAATFRDYLVPSHKMWFLEGEVPRWLLQDNLKAHKVGEAHRALHEAGFTEFEFPPYSPDLNPIENLWRNVQARVDLHPLATKEQVEQALIAEWEKTSSETCGKLARSMPRRIAKVIAARGAYSGY